MISTRFAKFAAGAAATAAVALGGLAAAGTASAEPNFQGGVVGGPNGNHAGVHWNGPHAGHAGGRRGPRGGPRDPGLLPAAPERRVPLGLATHFGGSGSSGRVTQVDEPGSHDGHTQSARGRHAAHFCILPMRTPFL